MNFNIIHEFLNNKERDLLINFCAHLSELFVLGNKHIYEVAKSLNGNSFVFDITKTEISTHLARFQSSNNILNITLPGIFYQIANRISDSLNISKENIFLQIIVQKKGGKIKAHYDSSYPGYINFKCNIPIVSGNYKIYIDKSILDVSQCDLYTFEASLYKHWTEEFDEDRILLSYGFILPYNELGWDESDPRIRMSQRIEKYFQN